MGGPSDGSHYEVKPGPHSGKQIRAIHQRAMADGGGNLILAAYDLIVRSLQSEPFDFGEPMFRYHGLRAEMRIGIIAPLCITFLVAEDFPVVTIRDIVELGTSGDDK